MMPIQLEGMLIEIGDLTRDPVAIPGRRGIRLSVGGGQLVELTGLTKEDCIAIGGQRIGERVKVIVEAVQS